MLTKQLACHEHDVLSLLSKLLSTLYFCINVKVLISDDSHHSGKTYANQYKSYPYV